MPKLGLLVMTACLVQLGCSGHPDPLTNFHLATVAVAQREGFVFVSRPGFGVVDVLQIPPSAASQAPRFVARLADPHRRHVLRLAIDGFHGRLWVADARVVQAYEIANLNELRKYLPPSDAYHERFSDLTVDRLGNAFVLARGGARIYRIDAISLDMEVWLDLSQQASDAAVLLANRLLKSEDDQHLFMPSPDRDELLRIDLRSKEIARLALTANTHLTCGILLWDREATSVRAFDCAGDWDAYVTPSADLRAASVDFRGRARPRGTVSNFH